jgi:hypothetical protein
MPRQLKLNQTLVEERVGIILRDILDLEDKLDELGGDYNNVFGNIPDKYLLSKTDLNDIIQSKKQSVAVLMPQHELSGSATITNNHNRNDFIPSASDLLRAAADYEDIVTTGSGSDIYVKVDSELLTFLTNYRIEFEKEFSIQKQLIEKDNKESKKATNTSGRPLTRSFLKKSNKPKDLTRDELEKLCDKVNGRRRINRLKNGKLTRKEYIKCLRDYIA